MGSLSYLLYALLALLLLTLSVYLLLLLRSLRAAATFFRLYSATPLIRGELSPDQLRVVSFPFLPHPRLPQVLASRLLELEALYDFVDEVGGIDLSSIRRDYFKALREGLGAGVVHYPLLAERGAEHEARKP